MLSAPLAKEEAQGRERDEPQGDPEQCADGPDHETAPCARLNPDAAATTTTTMVGSFTAVTPEGLRILTRARRHRQDR